MTPLVASPQSVAPAGPVPHQPHRWRRGARRAAPRIQPSAVPTPAATAAPRPAVPVLAVPLPPLLAPVPLLCEDAKARRWNVGRRVLHDRHQDQDGRPFKGEGQLG